MAKRVTKNVALREQQAAARRRHRKWIGLGLILGAAAILATAAVFYWQEQEDRAEMEDFRQSHQNSYEDVLNRYYQAILSENGAALAQIMAPPEYWTYYLEAYDRTEAEVTEMFAESCGQVLAEWEASYGTGLQVSYQVLGVSEPAQEGLDEWNQQMASLLGNEGAQITDAITAEVVVTVTGSADTGELTFYPTLVQMGESWYMLEEDNSTLQGEA